MPDEVRSLPNGRAEVYELDHVVVELTLVRARLDARGSTPLPLGQPGKGWALPRIARFWRSTRTVACHTGGHERVVLLQDNLSVAQAPG